MDFDERITLINEAKNSLDAINDIDLEVDASIIVYERLKTTKIIVDELFDENTDKPNYFDVFVELSKVADNPISKEAICLGCQKIIELRNH